MLRALYFAGIAGALLWAWPVLAQREGERRDSDGRDIVVTGQAPEEPPTQREVTRQARAITVPTGIRYYPLPLFGDRLCPGVYGLKADYAAMVIDRIRANAERFDLWISDDDGTCEPNFIVAFVDDGQAMLQQIADERRWLFEGLPRHERVTLLAEDGPARVWTATETRTRDGMPLAGNQMLGDGQDPVDGVESVQLWNASSRIYLPVREDITWVLVLIDRDDARARTLLQLADYATMRGLARTRPIEADGAPVDTILSLFDDTAEPPGELTAFDSAYLGAIYRGLPNLTGLSKVQGVNREMRRQAAAAAAGDEARSSE